MRLYFPPRSLTLLQRNRFRTCSLTLTSQVWELSKFKLKTNHYGHTGYVNTVAVSPDGSLAASGGKDGITMLWDLNEGKHLYSLEAGDIVNALVFSPNRYWLCAATATCVKIFDLESKYAFYVPWSQLFADRSASGPSLTSSSPLTLMSVRMPVNPSASPLPGPLMARPFSLGSPTTLSVSGPLHHKNVLACYISDSIIFSFAMTKDPKHVNISAERQRRLELVAIVFYSSVNGASRRLRSRSAKSHLSRPPKSIFIPRKDMLNCSSQTWVTRARQLSPL